MHLRKLWLGFVLIVLIIPGCSGSPWTCGSCNKTPVVGTQDACGNVNCAGKCKSHPWSAWYPGKHMIRGFHHACSLFTCYGCGGNCWCGQGYNAGEISNWNTLPGEVAMDQQLEPIPTTSASPSSNLETPQTPTEQ